MCALRTWKTKSNTSNTTMATTVADQTSGETSMASSLPAEGCPSASGLDREEQPRGEQHEVDEALEGVGATLQHGERRDRDRDRQQDHLRGLQAEHERTGEPDHRSCNRRDG